MNRFSKFIVFTSIAMSGLIFSCTSNDNQKDVLSPQEFKTAMANKEALILDVRTTKEMEKGKLDNAVQIDWNLGEANFEEQIKNVPKDKKILVYCQGGSRSATAANKLRAMGYTDVQELDGGIVAWNSAFQENNNNANKATGMTMAEFNELIKTDKVVLVDFNAEWCPPCQKMKPFLYEIQKSRQEDVSVVFIDTDKNPDIANLFKITGLPTLMIYKDGVKQWHHEGYMDKEGLLKEINTYKN